MNHLLEIKPKQPKTKWLNRFQPWPSPEIGWPEPRARQDIRLLRVLIVDDDPKAAKELTSHVRSWGHAARSACDGYLIRSIAAIQNPDVVIINLDSASIDWLNVVAQLRRDFKRINCFVIGLTALDNDRFRQHCDTAGMDLVLQLPLNRSVLETLLFLENHRLQRLIEDCPAK